MITARQLMIGNYVQDVVSGELMIVDEIGENVGATIVNPEKYPLAGGWEMGPVALTPEILERFGLKRYSRAADYITADENHPLDFTGSDFADGGTVMGWEMFDNGSFFFGRYEGEYWPVMIGANHDETTGIHKIGCKVEFVHQLQNLYFALTGEELTVKTEK